MTPATKGEVKRAVTDGPYAWNAAYRATETPDGGVVVNVRMQVQAAAGVGNGELAEVKRETAEAVARWYDGRFALQDSRGAKAHPLTVAVQFVDQDPDLKVTVRPGAGRDNLENWHVRSGITARGHELGHALGLKDEYVDPEVLDRATSEAAGIRRDGSLMGNFYAEGVDRAELKERHGEVLAADLSQALGRELRAVPGQTLAQGEGRSQTGPPAPEVPSTMEGLRALARQKPAAAMPGSRAGARV